MKTKILSIGLILVLGVSLNSCRKGENDPFISLKSRDARITGEWELTKSSYKYTHVNSSATPYTYEVTNEFDGKTVTHTETGTTNSSYSYSYEMTIEKEGTYSYTEISSGHKDERTGEWYWFDNNKSKMGIFLCGGLLHVDRLTSKEMILTSDSYSKDTQTSGDSDEYTTTLTMTYTKK